METIHPSARPCPLLPTQSSSDDLFGAEESFEVKHLPTSYCNHQHDVKKAEPDDPEGRGIVRFPHPFLPRADVKNVIVVIPQRLLHLTQGDLRLLQTLLFCDLGEIFCLWPSKHRHLHVGALCVLVLDAEPV